MTFVDHTQQDQQTQQQTKLKATRDDMPAYLCHKEVQALKIKSVEQPNPTDSALVKGTKITFEDGRFEPLWVEPEVTARRTPIPGDYYVVYKDGYQSFSPAAAFEEGYVKV